MKNGVVIKRGILNHLAEAATFHEPSKTVDVIVNCTGLSSSRLGGVEDKALLPARGQTVLVHNTPGRMMTISGTDDGEDEVAYIMQRAAGEFFQAHAANLRAENDIITGGGTILGGCYQKGNWESQPDPNLAVRIMKRCVDLCPELTGGKGIEALHVIRHGVGLRPLRIGGVRLEIEHINGVSVVHNYGHGGFGYQSSYGCAQAAVRLVEKAHG